MEKTFYMNSETLKAIDNLLKQNRLQDTLIYLKKTKKTLPKIFVIPFLASRAIMSGGNDHRNGDFNAKNIEYAFNKYFKFKDPFLVDNELEDFFIRTYFEQFTFNIYANYTIARNYYIFHKLSKENYKFKANKINYDISLQDYFVQETGLNLHDYFKLNFIIYSYINKYYDVFDEMTFIKYINTYENQIKSNFHIPVESLTNYLNILSCDYTKFREIYAEKNNNLESLYIKNAFNPLNVHPIIKTQQKNYIVPCEITFIRKSNNLFWFFEELIDKDKPDEEKVFRNKIFDKLFENYVGDLLKNIFGDTKVQRIENYKTANDEFFDWIVEEDSTVYLFEAKGYQLSVANSQTGEITRQILDKIIKKPLGQMFKRIKDLETGKYTSINQFKNKRCIPIAIYYDIPFVSGNFYKSKMEKLINDTINADFIQNAIGKNNNIEEFKQFDYYLMNINELECYQDVAHQKTLAECLERTKITGKLGNSFETVLREIKGSDTLRCPFLENEINFFFNTIIKNSTN